MKKVILIVLDGYGISDNEKGNPIKLVNPPNINYLQNNFPFTTQGTGRTRETFTFFNK